ncbi:MAG: LPS export ABC transporter permease LptF [Rhodobacteraceae bacterium]|nr:LPS export ABC transporter permease LptF [Paracoccaceae bacterium]
MKQIDRYVLRLLVGPFLFFLVIFAGIIWLNQALRIVDVVVSNGQSGIVFAELSFYLLPKVTETVVPIAAFSAAIYLTNRLYSESELVVIMSVGRSPALATLPYLIFGGICMILMTGLTHFLTPLSVTSLQDRQHEMSKEYLTQFIVEGEFNTPEKGVTIFFGTTSPEGHLTDVLINDRRSPSTVVTHTATKGRIISDDVQPKLVLLNGSVQRYQRESGTLNIVQFDSLAYDLSQFAKDVQERRISARELSTLQLLSPKPGGPASELKVTARTVEAHDRFVKSLLAVVVPVIGAIILISSGYDRSGFFLRIVLGVVFMVGINSLRGLMQSWVANEGAHWIVLYVPVALGIASGILLIKAGMADWKSGLKGIFLRREAPI